MSNHNPYDDEEFLTETTHYLPPDEEVDKFVSTPKEIIDEASLRINEHFDDKNLMEIMVSFEYQDEAGFTSWRSTHYVIKRES